MSRKIVVLLVVIFLLISAIVIIVPNSIAQTSSNNRTNDSTNQPATGYSEGSDIFEIYNDTGVHKTKFEFDENITVRVTTDRVDWSAGGPQRINRLRIYNYTGNNLAEYVFEQQAGGPPYIYNITFLAPGDNNSYLVTAELRDSPQQGRDDFIASDVIMIGNGSTPLKNMTTYSDPGCQTPSWLFGNMDNVYIKVYTPNTIDPADSFVTLSDYQDNFGRIAIDNFVNYTITEVENDSIIVFNLYDDLDLTDFPDHELKGNYWYTLSVDLNDLTSTQMAADWATQIEILPPPSIELLECNPSVIFADGVNSTTIFSEFTDANGTGPDEFNVTFKVRDPNNDVILLVDNKTNGQAGLTITDLGSNRYNASYTWTPPIGVVYGAYDLHVSVYDGQNGTDASGFVDNQDELILLKPGVLPILTAGNTTCTPGRVNIMSNDEVTFKVNFTDKNDPALGVDDFVITLKIQDQEQNEIIIAENKNSGDLGDAPGSGNLLITNDIATLYSATINWNPNQATPLGEYDLFSSISTMYGSVSDDYTNNEKELEIYSTGHEPELQVGDTTCVPKSLDIIGTNSTMIYCEFTDADNPAPTVFNVTFKVRPPSNNMADVLTLVANKANGGAGEYGGSVKVEQSGNTYVASYHWDPPIDVDLGDYDLYFMVRDEYNNTAEDPFAQNQDELELISSVTPPTIKAGDTTCVPKTVNKIGSGTTTLYCEFSDSTYTDVDDFKVTFKIRDQNNNEIILVDNMANGESGEDANQTSQVEITTSGPVFTAWYEWDPPITTTPGTYDLYFGVKNKEGGYAKDKFENNLDELTVISSGNPPEIKQVGCKPNKIAVKGTETTTIYALFTDADNPAIQNFTVTFKVRDPNGTELILVKAKKHGGGGEFGGTLNVINTTEGYNASYAWDPAEDVVLGKYDLYFTVKDETMSESEDGFENNLDELELTGEAPPPPGPKIEPQEPTKDGNKYTFVVNYIDLYNVPPDEDGVRLFIDSTSYKMEESDKSDTNYTDGKKYKITIELEEGDYTYYFKVRNANGEVFKGEDKSLSVPPVTKPEEPEEEEEGDNTMLAAGIAAIIVIIVILLLLMLLRKRKPEEKEMEEEPRIAKPVEPGMEEEGAPLAAPVGEGEEGEMAVEGEAEEEVAAPTEEAKEAEAPGEEEPITEGEAPVEEETPETEAEAAEEPIKEEEMPEEVAEEPVKEGEAPPTEEAPPEEAAPEPETTETPETTEERPQEGA